MVRKRRKRHVWDGTRVGDMVDDVLSFNLYPAVTFMAPDLHMHMLSGRYNLSLSFAYA